MLMTEINVGRVFDPRDFNASVPRTDHLTADHGRVPSRNRTPSMHQAASTSCAQVYDMELPHSRTPRSWRYTRTITLRTPYTRALEDTS